ncbi:LuxR C-terminal-related transcriptional regulator [Microvirga sp. 2TAF3]|uniref:LuxR C-terminal-related transcriptional regulator n=1 Tax=Microvirga sp. 2TAF3 TaxID=3233014 RepID=UPI003F96680A
MPQNILPIATFLVCKNAMLCEGIRHILSGTRYRVHSVDPISGNEALSGVSEMAPALFILDANLHHHQTCEAVRRLKAQYPKAYVVVLDDCFDLNDMLATLDAGAGGYCLATIGCDALVKYLDLVMLGETVFPSTMFFSAVTAQKEMSVAPQAYPFVGSDRIQPVASGLPTRMLSTREAEILHCLMEGAPNKTIARKLEVAEATVKVHVKAILRKIRVTNRTQAAMWAVAHLSNATDNDQHAVPI